ncbi:MAG: sensor histidine kinase [Rufibacter sp.]
MSFSFIAQYNPKNTLTFYLLGLITVAFLWNFEYYESLLIALLTGLAFAVGLHFTTLSAEQKIMNHCVSFFILVAFFVISRIMYSYRATHFDQFKEIEAKNQEVQQVSRAKSEILGVVAHDLRSPFATIEMLATVLQQGNLSLQEERQYLELIQTSCQTSRHIINEILEVAHEQKPQEFPLEKANLCQFLQEIHQEWQLQLQGSRQLVFLRPTKPVYAQVNKERLQRVLNNLLSNALKFTSEKSEIQIQLKETDKKVLLEVRDQGIGIPKDLTPYLFDRFSAARRKGLNGEKSIGLGLSICRELVEQHGGSIEVESNESQGTTFVITLPALN